MVIKTIKSVISNSTKIFKDLCTPAKVESVLGIVGTISVLIACLTNSTGSKLQVACTDAIPYVVVSAILVYILNALCKGGAKFASWIFVLTPLALILLSIFVINPPKESFIDFDDDELFEEELPKPPTEPGCFVYSNDRCPKQSKYSDRHDGKWHQDKWGQENKGSGESKEKCDLRKKGFNDWCGSTDFVSHFNPAVQEQEEEQEQEQEQEQEKPEKKESEKVTKLKERLTRMKGRFENWDKCSFFRNKAENCSTKKKDNLEKRIEAVEKKVKTLETTEGFVSKKAKGKKDGDEEENPKPIKKSKELIKFEKKFKKLDTLLAKRNKKCVKKCTDSKGGKKLKRRIKKLKMKIKDETADNKAENPDFS